MEILSRILAEKAKSPMFKFHWRCDKTKIVNLCFADDLMIFSKGKEILHIAKFNEGTLPVKYLGVPLITTKPKAFDCQILIDRIAKRIRSWTNKLLSYAGRAQLIQTILFSMQVYWSSMFILPRKVIRDIESLLRAFLWSGSDLKKHSAKIDWRGLYVVPMGQGKEAQVEWCEPLNCGLSGVRSYIEGTVSVLKSSRLYLICWRYLLMAVLTGSTIMYEQVLGCMARQWCPVLGTADLLL
ncbi:uncharacterized protein LOC114275678 [Camellia sinensis]|uniref:uncharacterized protein LOC114275678 n=1 Tax=Camellia sinensis TaxID=4442 RepID=UPI0010369FF1|nr:uncharacterized protein LOC114275678 [Camellia sinensis]